MISSSTILFVSLFVGVSAVILSFYAPLDSKTECSYLLHAEGTGSLNGIDCSVSLDVPIRSNTPTLIINRTYQVKLGEIDGWYDSEELSNDWTFRTAFAEVQSQRRLQGKGLTGVKVGPL
jgi:hypothetical protein